MAPKNVRTLAILFSMLLLTATACSETSTTTEAPATTAPDSVVVDTIGTPADTASTVVAQ
jgi:ABC-type Zn uptake system ZnuABC Zn-binding protein ZnuA